MVPPLDQQVQQTLRQQGAEAAVTLVVRELGPELLGFVVSLVRDYDRACDAFSRATEDLWRGLPGFRWESSLRAWAYAVTRNATYRYLDGWYERARLPLSRATVWEGAEQEVRTRTMTFLRTESRSKVTRLREQLSLDDNTLLVLRVDRDMPWREIAQVLRPELAGDDAQREAAALRKRFERVKARLRELAKAEGLVEPK